MQTTPVNSKQNAQALLRRFLMNASEIRGAVGSNIRTSHAETPDADLSYPLIILDFGSGVGGYQGGFQRWVVDLYVYSDEGQGEATALYDKLFTALQAERLHDATGAISTAGYAREVDRPQEGYNEQTRSWFSRGTWVIMVAG